MTESVATTQRSGWYHGWNIVAACVIAQALANGMGVNAFSLFLKDWSTDLNAPISTLQLALLPLGLLSGILSAVVGILADKYPARWLFGIGLLGVILFELGIGYVTEFWQLQLLFGILLPTALTFASSVPGNAIISRWFVRRVGMAMGIASFGLGAAGAFLPPIIAAVMPDYGWRTIWRVAGIVTIVLAPFLLWVFRDRPTERDGLDYLTADGNAPARAGHGHGGAAGNADLNWKDIFKRRNFWLLVVAYIPQIAVYGGIAQNLAPIAESQGISQQTAGVLISALGVASVVATLATGMLSDRFGNRLPLAGLAFLVALGGILAASGQGVVTLAPAAVLAGLYTGIWPLLGSAVSVEFGSNNVGKAFGQLSLFIPLISIPPFAVAKTQEVTGSYAPALLVLSALAVVGGVSALMIRERRGPATA